ncbi:Crp/Fnr family transcriptional regulator, partial [Hymenobacter guriensis]
NRFQHLRPDYDLQQDGLNDFLDDARQVSSLQSLSEDRRPHAVARKQVVYDEGDVAARIYFVQAGQVKTSKITTAGKELITGLYQAGEFFGYKALLEGTAHSDSAAATENSVLRYIPADDFTQLLLRNPEVSQQFVRLLAGRVREQEVLLLDMAYNSLRRRVGNMLLRLYQRECELTPAAPHIHISRDDMAALVGTAPESLSRTLSEFRQAGIVELTSKFIRVVQPEKLRSANW